MKFGIIAAGHGSRLSEEGVELPKPMVEIGGMPMIGRLICLFEECNAESISVIVNENMPEVADYLDKLKPKLKCNLKWDLKSTPSSMHTMKELCMLMGREGRFVVTTVDTIFLKNDFKKYVEAFSGAPENIDAMMAVTDFIDDEKPLYVKVDNEMRITGFLDCPEPDIKYVSGGIYGLSGPCIDVLDECLVKGQSRMRNFQRALVENGLDLSAYPIRKIIDVDHAGDIAKAREFVGKE